MSKVDDLIQRAKLKFGLDSFIKIQSNINFKIIIIEGKKQK
jgi:hypothetical protein